VRHLPFDPPSAPLGDRIGSVSTRPSAAICRRISSPGAKVEVHLDLAFVKSADPPARPPRSPVGGLLRANNVGDASGAKGPPGRQMDSVRTKSVPKPRFVATTSQVYP